MNTLMICILLLSFYIGIESWLPICKMGSGLTDFCHKAKYGVALLSAFAYATYAAVELLGMTYIQPEPAVDWLVFGSAGSLALFVWPRTLYRLRDWRFRFNSPRLRYATMDFKDRLERFFKTGEWIR